VPLDGFYGNEPLLQAPNRLKADGALAIIHAAGSEDDTRPTSGAGFDGAWRITGGGWLGRFLRAQNQAAYCPLAPSPG
jgi:uncharacterized protein (DUF1501 family)